MENEIIYPITKLETFCKNFTPDHIQVFIDILPNIELNQSITKEAIRKLNRGIELVQVFVQDGEHGFPHGGIRLGVSKSIDHLVGFLDDLLSKITDVIVEIYDKLIRKQKSSYTLRKGYGKKWVRLVKDYEKGLYRWEQLIEPVLTMIAEPVERRHNRSYKIAKSRIVNTMNHLYKKPIVPHASRYTGYNQWTHRNQLPIGEFIRQSYSPKRTRTRKSKPKTIQTEAQGTRF
jgi:hypothetical protein